MGETYIVVFRRRSDGRTDYGVLGAYSDRKVAEQVIKDNTEANTDFTIAVMP